MYSRMYFRRFRNLACIYVWEVRWGAEMATAAK